MPYNLYLTDPATKKTIQFSQPHFMTGGTYEIGGTSKAWLNITYNYSYHFYMVIDQEKGIRKIYGMTGAESIPMLKQAISKLRDDISDNYYEATEGNAKQALQHLLALAKMRPDGIWGGD